jgi:hypothetical protein
LAKAWARRMPSENARNAMATAAGAKPWMSDQRNSGMAKLGMPEGTSPTSLTPRSPRPRNRVASTLSTETTRALGILGNWELNRISSRIMTLPNIKVGIWVSCNWLMTCQIRGKKFSPSVLMAKSLPNWVAARIRDAPFK